MLDSLELIGKGLDIMKKTKIYKRGKWGPGSPFHGEMMTCHLCGKQQKSDPEIESGWTLVTLYGNFEVYICPDELGGLNATKAERAAAWEKVLRLLLS
jgi:hypothetical protein